MYFTIAVIQTLWLPIAVLGFLCYCISNLIEIGHIELCHLVSLIKNKF